MGSGQILIVSVQTDEIVEFAKFVEWFTTVK